MGFKVKICGLKTPEALEAALQAGADLVGFVHFPGSPRHLSLEAAPGLIAGVKGRARMVALSVDADDDLLARIVAAFSPDMLQLHGAESPARVAAVRARFGLPVIKALPVATPADLARVAEYAAVADMLLFDARPDPGALLPGGNGRPFDWHLLAALDVSRPVMLSGGLTPENVAEALRVARVDGVDVSSGVEDAPGVKSAGRILAFVAAARAAAAARRDFEAAVSPSKAEAS